MSDAAKISESEYCRIGGTKCPWCEAEEGLQRGELKVNAGIATQEIGCNLCGKSWTDKYRLCGVDYGYVWFSTT